MEEFVTKLVNLQCYIPYFKDEKDKIYQFISCLSLAYKDKIEFDMPITMDEAIKKSKLCYPLFKQRSELSRNCQNKNNENMEQRKKGYKPYPLNKGMRIYTYNNYNRSG